MRGQRVFWGLLAISLFLISMDCVNYKYKIGPSEQGILLFSGYRWIVKSSENSIRPGPNYFSNTNVWVDKQGQLHLKITRRNGRWYCAQITSEKFFGYGKYIFYLKGRIDQLDKNVVVGLFTWDKDAHESHYCEIDIEFARWGQLINDNAQFVVQPSGNRPENKHRFNIQLKGKYSTHSFNWKGKEVFFQSFHDHYLVPPNNNHVIKSWDYNTSENILESENVKVKINLWLFKGMPPSDNREIEIIIKKFEFVPQN